MSEPQSIQERFEQFDAFPPEMSAESRQIALDLPMRGRSLRLKSASRNDSLSSHFQRPG